MARHPPPKVARVDPPACNRHCGCPELQALPEPASSWGRESSARAVSVGSIPALAVVYAATVGPRALRARCLSCGRWSSPEPPRVDRPRTTRGGIADPDPLRVGFGDPEQISLLAGPRLRADAVPKQAIFKANQETQGCSGCAERQVAPTGHCYGAPRRRVSAVRYARRVIGTSSQRGCPASWAQAWMPYQPVTLLQPRT